MASNATKALIETALWCPKTTSNEKLISLSATKHPLIWFARSADTWFSTPIRKAAEFIAWAGV
ncbi:hypothetical protein ABUK73_06465 [Agrobacterium sp. BA1120]